MAALEATNGKLPVTVTARTGSNGIHYYFGYPGPEYRNTAGLLGVSAGTVRRHLVRARTHLRKAL